jgi:hypothetical protein
MALSLVSPPKPRKEGPYGERPLSKSAAKKKLSDERKNTKAVEKERVRDPLKNPRPGDRVRPVSGFLLEVVGCPERRVVVRSDPDGDVWRHDIPLARFRSIVRMGTVVRKGHVG